MKPRHDNNLQHPQTEIETLRRQLQGQTEQLHALYQIGLATTKPSQPIDQLLGTIYEQCLTIFSLDSFYIALCNEDETRIDGIYVVDEGKRIHGVSTALRPDQPSFAVHVYFTKKPLHIHDVEKDPLPAQWMKIEGGTTHSYIGVPLLLDDKAIGVISIQSYRPNAYVDADVHLLSSIANLATIAIANAQSYKALTKQARWAQVTNEIINSVQVSTRPEDIVHVTMRHLIRIVPPDIGCFFRFDDRERKLIPTDIWPDSPQAHETCRMAAAQYVSRIISAERENGAARFSNIITTSQGEWLLGNVTLHTLHGFIALFKTNKEKESRWGEAEQQLIGAIASHVATAIENSKLFYQEQQRRLLLEGLQTTTAEIIAERDLQIAIDTINRQAATVFKADATSIMLWDDDRENLIIKAHYGLSQDYVSGQKIPRSVLEKSDISENNPIFIMEPLAEVAHGDRGIILREKLVTDLVAVLFFRGEIVGALNIYSRNNRRRFTEDEFSQLRLFANQSAIAIQNALLYTQLRQSNRRLETAVEQRTMELRQEKERLEAIIQHAADGIVFADPEGSILYVNPAWEELTGYTFAEIEHKNDDLINAEDRPMINGGDWKRLRTGQTVLKEHKIRRKDGRLIETELSITPILDRHNTLTYLVSVQHDITQAKELIAMKEQFVSNVSHELRTPLTNIKLFLSLLRKGKPDKQAHYLEVLDKETDRLSRLIEDLLKLSRLTDSKRVVTKEQVHVGDVIDEVVETYRPSAEQKGLHLHDFKAPNLVPIKANRQNLTQILVNLVGNAINYIQPGDEIWVSAQNSIRDERLGVLLKVQDTGPGIPVEEQPHIFDRFYRGHHALFNNTPGTGLGLAIVEEIVQQHGGQITLHSKPGEGTTFLIWLPQCNEEQENT